MKPVLDAVVKLVNTIRSRGLTHKKFRDFLQSVQSEYFDVLYYTKVRWLSAGCVFERVWQLKDDIVSFFHEKQCSAECEMLEDTEWLFDLCIFHRFSLSYEQLECQDAREKSIIDDIWAHLKAFKLKLNLFAGQLVKNDLSHFSRLNSIPSVNEEKLKNYEDGLKKLHFEFERRFQDFSAIQTELDIFTMSFNVNCEAVRSDLQLELIELQSSNHLKQSFLNMPKLEFYKSLSKLDCKQAIPSSFAFCVSGTVGTEKKYYIKKVWPKLQFLIPGVKNEENELLVVSEKILLPPLHIKLGLMKNFVKAMDCGGSGFQYLRLKFPKVSEKNKEGIFVGPQFRQLMKDPVLESKLTKKEAAAWTSFKELEKSFFGNHKAED
ncbi:General transcription factor II-I repeat domain-containing protein 2A [Araneus ventricosus]|uniref:General transcription factor II-I repeat domain-containing protein 2A n=1 Tax=Araneus ventricosus TaxID=182803 RepID=A0A4Y2BJW1_ARAVE|nr:General transcription factor II-I repeat domain-containing protein 2A [Araneus ventricosus]